MSNLLEQASLVMIPSGYAEDIVYSEIPLDGSGDLQLTRASNGTRVNSAGLVEVCPWNFMQQSNAFSTSPWAKSSTTLTSGQSDPNGGTSAWKVEFAGGGNAYLGQFAIGQIGVVTISAYFRADSTTTIGFNDGSAYANSITIGTTWQRYEFSYTVSGVQCNMQIDNYFGVSPSGQAKTFYIYGAQLNIGSTAKPYFPTTDRLNVPRLTYQNGGGGCPSLLLEKQSTNLVAYSQDLANAVHTQLNVTITSNNTTSPDGTQNADKFTETTATGEHILYDQNSTASGTYTVSAFFKSGAGTIFPVLRLNGADATAYAGCIFNTSTGAVVNTFYNTYSAPTTKVENMGNGWYRVSMTTTTTNTFFGIRIVASNSASPSFGAYGAISYTGSTSNYFYAWGAQLEASSYPTSYIPTTSSSATRVSDDCFKTGISSLIGQTEGVLFVDLQNPSGGDIASFGLNTSNTIYIRGGYDNSWSAGIIANSVEYAFTSVSNSASRIKIAIAYKSGDSVLYINGVQAQQITSSFSFTASLSSVRFDPSAFYFSGPRSATYNQAIIFPTRLTNAELASLTTL